MSKGSSERINYVKRSNIPATYETPISMTFHYIKYKKVLMLFGY